MSAMADTFAVPNEHRGQVYAVCALVVSDEGQMAAGSRQCGAVAGVLAVEVQRWLWGLVASLVVRRVSGVAQLSPESWSNRSAVPLVSGRCVSVLRGF